MLKTKINGDDSMVCASEFDSRVYPNGECVVWRVKTFQPDMPVPIPSKEQQEYRDALVWCRHSAPGLLAPDDWDVDDDGLPIQGLSIHAIFDKTSAKAVRPRARKGLKGIPASAQRTVRNAVYLLEEKYGIARLMFATCTLPPMADELMAKIHKNWPSVIERYRLLLRRSLVSKGLKGSSVIVSEVQTKRSTREGRPILHLHAVFCNVDRSGRWALSHQDHDEIWASALESVLGEDTPGLGSACNMQRVRKSAQGYLGKYMSKGSAAIANYVRDGYADWLPSHWYSMSRVLRKAVVQRTIRTTEISMMLLDDGMLPKHEFWESCGGVYLDLDGCPPYLLSLVGRLKPDFYRQIYEIAS